MREKDFDHKNYHISYEPPLWKAVTSKAFSSTNISNGPVLVTLLHILFKTLRIYPYLSMTPFILITSLYYTIAKFWFVNIVFIDIMFISWIFESFEICMMHLIVPCSNYWSMLPMLNLAIPLWPYVCLIRNIGLNSNVFCSISQVRIRLEAWCVLIL